MANDSVKTALVAGGTGGLGRAVSLAFLGEGTNVVVTYRRPEELDALTREAGSDAARLDGRAVDVIDEAAVQQLVRGIVTKYGRLDVLVNTVGGYAGGAKLWELETEVFDRMLDLNLRSTYALARAAARAMLAQGHGVIVNVASKAAVDHEAGQAAYAASKAAALALIDCLSAELKGAGVRVHSVLPSIIDTEPNRKAMPGADFAKWPTPAEIARVILFLSGDGAGVLHGAAIPVYGDR